MLALSRALCWCFIQGLYYWLYIAALYHGFILGFMLGVMSLMFQAAPCELNPLVQGAHYWPYMHYSADSANLDFRLVMLFLMPQAN